MPRHLRLAVLLIGQELIVGVAHEANVLDAVLASSTEGLAVVVELEALAGLAACPADILEGAAASVALVHRPPDGRRDVA